MISPLKQKKVKDELKEELKQFKKSKPLISKATVKRVTGTKGDISGCMWIENWIDQLIRNYSYPPQLKSDDFVSLLSRYFDIKLTCSILERLKKEYFSAFSLGNPTDDLAWLSGVLDSDPSHLRQFSEPEA